MKSKTFLGKVLYDTIQNSLCTLPTIISSRCLRVTTQNFKQNFKSLIIQKECLSEKLRELRECSMKKVTKAT